jgi:hypothetical protein
MTNNPLMDLRRLDEEKRRKSSAIPETVEGPTQETNVSALQDYNVTSNEVTLQDTQQSSPQDTVVTNKPAPRERGRSEKNKSVSPAGIRDTPLPASSDTREERLAVAIQLVQEDEPGVVTIRVSPRLNAYLDRYVQRVNQIDPRRRYRKQDAVAEAFAAFYADHPMPPAPRGEDEL